MLNEVPDELDAAHEEALAEEHARRDFDAYAASSVDRPHYSAYLLLKHRRGPAGNVCSAEVLFDALQVLVKRATFSNAEYEKMTPEERAERTAAGAYLAALTNRWNA